MVVVAIQQMADRIAGLMEERLRAKGNGLADKLARNRSALPRSIHAAAADLAKAAEQAQNPKLFRLLDQEATAANYDLCLRHLNGLNKWQRRRAFTESWALSLTVSLMILAALIAALLHWRGYF